jgi:hypothetical protein
MNNSGQKIFFNGTRKVSYINNNGLHKNRVSISENIIKEPNTSSKAIARKGAKPESNEYRTLETLVRKYATPENKTESGIIPTNQMASIIGRASNNELKSVIGANYKNILENYVGKYVNEGLSTTLVGQTEFNKLLKSKISNTESAIQDNFTNKLKKLNINTRGKRMKIGNSKKQPALSNLSKRIAKRLKTSTGNTTKLEQKYKQYSNELSKIIGNKNKATTSNNPVGATVVQKPMNAVRLHLQELGELQKNTTV